MIAKSDRASAKGFTTCFMAKMKSARRPPERSLRSSVVVAGNTMSARFADAVQLMSWTTIVSGFAQAFSRRCRS